MMSTDVDHASEKAGFSCLMVEDDLAFAALVTQIVREEGGQPTHCKTLAEARAVTAHRTFDLILLDNHLPDGKAYDFFDQLSRRNPDAPIIMITGLPALSEAIALTRNGLFDYLTKPVETDVLIACLRRARLRMRQPGNRDSDLAAFGNSAAMRGLLQQLGQAARHPAATVLFTGESGAGKDIAARMLHRLTFGDRATEAPYVALNCAAVPGEMFEAELFGAERGAYTGADKRRQGLVASAQGGTLFLDEIAEVPMASQAKLLRFLEGREFRPLGGTVSENFTGRFVAATNKSLHAEVAAGKFREDLLYRIEVFTIEIPSLRQRREDIPELAEHLLKHLANKYGRQTLLLRAEDLVALQGYSFPGNVRELRNILERGLLRTPDESRWLSLDLAWLKVSEPRPPIIASPVTASIVPTVAILDDALPTDRASLSPLEAQEYRMIRTALREVNGGIRRAAAKVGLSPQALLRRLEKWPELRTGEK
jgi:DNA-binding NtrC family response regulator